jgi:arylsulfatase
MEPGPAARRFRARPLHSPRPGPAAGRRQFVYTSPVSSLQAATAPNLTNRAYRITAEIEVPQGGANGMIVTDGGRFGGYGLYLVQGRPTFTYNFLDLARARWQGPALTEGRHTIVFEWQPDLGKVIPLPFGRGGTGTLLVDGQSVATRSMPRTIPLIMTLDETFDVGRDTGTPVDRIAAHGANGVRRTPRYDRGIPCGSSRSAVRRRR